jgi:diguanylate cyclase (GGDEF)-like protein/PAS domain S-box-containing protein
MPPLDMRTIFVCYLLVTFICVTVLATHWRQYRRRYRGLGLWVLGFAFQLPGLALVALRGAIPDLLSATLGNVSIVCGLLILLAGMRIFFGSAGRSAIDWAAFALFAATHAWLTVVRPDLGARIVAFSLAMLYVCGRGIAILARLGPGSRSIARGMTIVLSCFCLDSLARLAMGVAPAARTDLLADRSYDSIAMIVYLSLYVALTFAIVSLIGRRVFLDQEGLIAEKSRAEAALAASEEKFSKAFQASPDAITITRLADGRFIEVNEGFSRITGFTREEALGEPPVDLWGDPGRRLDLIGEISRQAFLRDREILLRAKSGRLIHTSYSGGLIELNGERHLVSVVRDLSEKDRAATILRVRLDLREYSVGHTMHELMVKALDEIEDMTGSRIGFYHIVDEEKGILSLLAWSTRTTREFCKAEVEAHYPIESAGVWADGIRERRPIIRNDYPSLPGRKGMPEGHAPVQRLLVAPTFRDGKIEAVLGVGNKSSDYISDDVALVSYVGDLVWTIVEQKRSDERILELNGQLEELAMTDELTGIANRRAFFAVAERELHKSSRYSSPLSFLMMDIDHFKLVNDRHGHDAGDAVLRTVAKALKGQVRDVDVAARLGGEEFGILMPNTRLADALVSAERLRAAVSRETCAFRGLELRVTVSIGVSARAEAAGTLDSIMKAADKAMYRAKESGRDAVASDAVASDAVASDAVASDAVASDAVASDAVASDASPT